MSDLEQQTPPDKTAATMDFWLRQNPLLYLLVVLVLGGHGFDFVNSNGLRDDVRAISKQLDDAMGRLDDEERLSAMFRRELDLLDRRVADLEGRVRDLEQQKQKDDRDRSPYNGDRR